MLNKNQDIEKIESDLDWLVTQQPFLLEAEAIKLRAPARWTLPEEHLEYVLSQYKLGLYYEGLVMIALINNGYEILHQSLQIIEEGVTRGEADFIIEDSGGMKIHLEVACKFYLEYCKNGKVLWLGPDARDSLAKKEEKMLTKQLKLKLPMEVDKRLYLLHVTKFDKLSNTNSENLWSYADEYHNNSIVDWYYLERLSWLSGKGAKKVADWNEEKKQILHFQKARQYAKIKNGEIKVRLFLVSRSWPLMT